MKVKMFVWAMSLVLMPAVAQAVVINEFVADHTGTDNFEFVEIFGEPNTDYSHLTVIEIEGDGTSAGLIDDGIYQVGTTDANGFWVSAFGSNILENGAATLLLVENFTGAVNDDIDTDDDGVIDATFWDAIVDSVAYSDGGLVYGVDLAPGYDGDAFQVGGASRIPDGVDTDSASDWVRNAFNGAGLSAFPTAVADPGYALSTPGAVNVAVPEPMSGSLLALASFIVFGMLRRR